jgi:hypothetical protein
MHIASSVKQFLEIGLGCNITVINLIWRNYLKSVPKGNSGLYAFKLFLKNAHEIQDPKNVQIDITYPSWDYFHLYKRLEDVIENACEDGGKPKRPRWLPTEITKNQLFELKAYTRDVVFYSLSFARMPDFMYN